jgi:hypothetical protein
MKIFASIALLILLFTNAAFAQKNSKYIGYRHKGVTFGKKLSNGVRSVSGGLTSNGRFGVSRYTKGKTYMLWLEEIISRDRDGVPVWVVRNVLTFDNLKPNEEFHFSYNSPCTLNGRENVDLIVKTEFIPQKNSYKVLEAWRANTKTMQFEKIDTAGIRCKTF